MEKTRKGKKKTLRNPCKEIKQARRTARKGRIAVRKKRDARCFIVAYALHELAVV